MRKTSKATASSDWMRRLADHYARFRQGYPDDRLLIVFDIDGTILDLRHMVRHVLLAYDQAHGSDLFHGLGVDDIDVHENRVEEFLTDRALPAETRERVMAWYLDHRWQPEPVLAAHRPYQGVLEVIRWFQLQPETFVALNTGRPERLRDETLRSLNALGREYRVEFRADLLAMNAAGGEDDVVDSKVAGLREFAAAGYRTFAVVDNEPAVTRRARRGRRVGGDPVPAGPDAVGVAARPHAAHRAGSVVRPHRARHRGRPAAPRAARLARRQRRGEPASVPRLPGALGGVRRAP